MKESVWCVYMLECSNRAFYTGITNNVDRRLQTHNAGRGARYTRNFRPVRLLWTEPHPDRSSATKREAQLKRWPRARKQALVHAQVAAK